MNRKKFIKSIFLTGVAGSIVPQVLKGTENKTVQSTIDSIKQQVGFNHLPIKENKTMNTVIHRADSRGDANHGWLHSRHTFSFANYYNPERMNFGALRVLNDDFVEAGMGFGTHPHANMEIVSIPLEGDLEHKDSMGHIKVIREGDVQVMSAGTGVTHSEYNHSKENPVKFLQIWIIPNKQNVEPRYDQVTLKDIVKENEFYQVVSPNEGEQGVWVHQDAWFHLGNFTQGNSTEYKIKKEGNGVYAFILEGEVSINGEKLNTRDGMGIWDVDGFNLEATKDARVLLMEVPMSL